MHQKLKFDIHFGFWIIQFMIQEMAFKICTKQRAGRKSYKGKQLKFAPLLGKFSTSQIHPIVV